MANVRFEQVSKIFDKTVVAVQAFDLEIHDKEFVVLVGPSGCGKSTTLRMIAGLEAPSTGKVFIGDRLVNDVPPKDRDIAMVFQNYALYPHMTVYENIAYGLRLRKFPKKIIDEKVRAAAESLDISELLQRKPKALSGGQRQRVAIGRAIVREPQVFLMDEPLSNLDAKLRNQMRAEILLLRRRLDTTFVYVTHDQVEAMTLGDRIVVMKDGVIQQVGTPQEVFGHPSNLFVAGFIGTPQMNFFEGQLQKENGRFFVEAGGFRVQLSEEKQERLFACDVQPQAITCGVRPEQLRLADSGIPAELGVYEMMGSSVHLHMKALEQDIVVVVPATDDAGHFRDSVPESGKTWLQFHGNAVHLFDRETGENLEYARKKEPETVAFTPAEQPISAEPSAPVEDTPVDIPAPQEQSKAKKAKKAPRLKLPKAKKAPKASEGSSQEELPDAKPPKAETATPEPPKAEALASDAHGIRLPDLPDFSGDIVPENEENQP